MRSTSRHNFLNFCLGAPPLAIIFFQFYQNYCFRTHARTNDIRNGSFAHLNYRMYVFGTFALLAGRRRELNLFGKTFFLQHHLIVLSGEGPANP